MASSSPIIIQNGINAGSPFALNHLVKVTNVGPPAQISTIPAEGLLDGAVEYVSVPNSAGVYVTVVGAMETFRVKGGAIIEGPGTDTVQIGRGITLVGGTGQIAIGQGIIGHASTRAVGIGLGANLSGSADVVIGANSGSGSGAPIGGIFIGDTAQGSANAGGADVIVIGNSALATLGVNPGPTGVVIGHNANVSHPGGVVLGCFASGSLLSAVAQNTVTIGDGATSTKAGTTVIGGASSTIQATSVVIGSGARGTGGTKTGGIVIGQLGTVGGADSIVIGRAGNITSDQAIAFGAGALDMGANVMQLGAPSTAIVAIVIGSGDSMVSPPARGMRFTDASGVDNAAGSFNLNVPRSTGAATPATLIFQTSHVGVSGAALQALEANLTLSDRLATFGFGISAAGLPTVAGAAGTLWVDTGAANVVKRV